MHQGSVSPTEWSSCQMLHGNTAVLTALSFISWPDNTTLRLFPPETWPTVRFLCTLILSQQSLLLQQINILICPSAFPHSTFLKRQNRRANGQILWRRPEMSIPCLKDQQPPLLANDNTIVMYFQWLCQYVFFFPFRANWCLSNASEKAVAER